jgi:PAS domain S-box-containing protein
VSVPASAVQVSTAAGTRSLWRKLAWPLSLACGFLVFVSASSVYLVISSETAREQMNHGLRLENRLWGITAAVRVAESEQRGYLLTGDPDYLEIYHSAVEANAAAVAEVRKAIAEDPAQRRELTEVEPLMARKFAELQETIRLHDSGDDAAALALVRTGVGRDLMTKIRAATKRLTERQRHLVSLQASNSVSTNLWLLLVNLVGLALIIVLAVIAIFVMRRAAGEQLAQSESRGDELRAAVNERQKNEQKFKEMLEAAPDAMVVVNQGGEIVLLNLQAEKQFGYRRDELLGQKVTNIIPDGFAERLIADGLRSAEDALAQQIGTGIELIGRRKDGAGFPIEIMLSPLESTEGILVTAAIRDISVRKDAETHLAQMEARYRGLLEAAPDAMVVVNQRGEIVLLNLQAEKEFGYRRDELLGQQVTNIIPDGFAERVRSDGLRSPAAALAQQIGTGIELVGRRKDGAEFPIEIMLSPLESAEGMLVTAAIRNIGVRKDAERHLAQMEARYRGLLEAAPDAMVVVNKSAEIVLVNLQAKLEFGYRRGELLGEKVTHIIPEGFAERLIKDGVHAMARQILKGIDLTGRRKRGEEFPIEIMLSPLESGEGILVIRDISLRKDEEKRVARMESRYRGLLQAAPDAMVVVNHGGEIVLANLQAEKEFGYAQDELLGQNMKNIIPEGFSERLLAGGLRSEEGALTLQIAAGIELTGLRKDRSEFPVEIMLSPLESAEGILVIRDISVRRLTERLKDEFVATVSHELRTPLTSISVRSACSRGSGQASCLNPPRAC